jgi:hypothetical protein
VFAAVLACWITFIGLPKGALPVFAWIWLATIAWNIRAPLRAHLDFPRDWSIPLAVLMIYLYSRGVADELGIVSVHVTEPIRVDRWLFGGTLPTEYLQAKLCGIPCKPTMSPRWYDVVLTTVYYSHFFVALTTAAVLWLRNRSVWLRFMRRYLSLNLFALVIYIFYPMHHRGWRRRKASSRRTSLGSPDEAGSTCARAAAAFTRGWPASATW